MKRGLLLLLLLGVLVQSCTNQATKGSDALPPSSFNINANEPSYKLQEKEDVITWYINFDWFPAKGVDQSLVAKKILADTKTQIEFIVGDDNRLNQMIVEGNLPDIITMDHSASYIKSAHRWAIPLNQLADAYDPYFYQVAKADSLEWYRDDHGNVYGYPNFANSYDDFLSEDTPLVADSVFLVRQDIYEAIGSPDMRTPSGFLQALRDAKAYNPQITALMLDVSGAQVDTLMDFLAIDKVQNGQYYERLFDPEYLRWLELLHIAHKEGLIIDDNFAIKHDDYYQGIRNGQYFATLTATMGEVKWSIVTNYTRNPKETYIAVDALSNSKGDQPHLSAAGPGGWTLTLVSNQAKDKERAIQLLTYMISQEGQITVNMGLEGESYYVAEDGYYYFTPKYEALRKENVDQFKKQTMLGGEMWMLRDSIFELRYLNTMPEETKQIYGWTRGKLYPQFAFDDVTPDPRSPHERNWKGYEEERGDVSIKMIKAKNKQEFDHHLSLLKEHYASQEIQEALEVINEKIKKNLAKIQKMG